jgi:hypothetical protein
MNLILVVKNFTSYDDSSNNEFNLLLQSSAAMQFTIASPQAGS